MELILDEQSRQCIEANLKKICLLSNLLKESSSDTNVLLGSELEEIGSDISAKIESLTPSHEA